MKKKALPPERQIDKSKLVEYLLHPVNSRGKLGHFSRYGYSQASWEDLRTSLLEHAQMWPVVDSVATEFGTKYIVTAERVNDFATPCFINLLCKFVFFQGRVDPLMEG